MALGTIARRVERLEDAAWARWRAERERRSAEAAAKMRRFWIRDPEGDRLGKELVDLLSGTEAEPPPEFYAYATTGERVTAWRILHVPEARERYRALRTRFETAMDEPWPWDDAWWDEA
jgi:hypothetical protein